MNFIAHHETKFSPAVGQAGSDHYQVTIRVRQPHQGHWLEAGSRGPSLSSRLAAHWAVDCIQGFPQLCVNSLSTSLKKRRGDLLSTAPPFLSRHMSRNTIYQNGII